MTKKSNRQNSKFGHKMWVSRTDLYFALVTSTVSSPDVFSRSNVTSQKRALRSSLCLTWLSFLAVYLFYSKTTQLFCQVESFHNCFTKVLRRCLFNSSSDVVAILRLIHFTLSNTRHFQIENSQKVVINMKG